MARTLILGAGFGGLSAATELRRELGERHEVVLVDSRERFSMGLRKLWELVGMGTMEAGSRPREPLNERGIEFRRGEVTSIDPDARAATIDGEGVGADHLVVALGAEPRSDLVPGLAEHELEGARVAAAIAAELRGDPPPPPFDGRGYCFVEMGKARASLVEGEFFAEPEPSVAITEPSADRAEEKHRFEAERLKRWFGG